MVRVTDKNFYMDGYLKKQLDFLTDCVARNWDGVFMIDGVEGGAKSRGLAFPCAYYLDNRFNLDKVVFTPKQFEEAVLTLPHSSAIVWDEFVLGGGLSTEFMTSAQKSIMKMFSTIRKKRLFIILIIPTFFNIAPYFSVHRSRFLLHIYTPDGISRGKYKIYTWDTKRKLYFKGKKEWNYSIVPADFKCSFYDDVSPDKQPNLFFSDDEYEAKKDEAIKSIYADKDLNKRCCPDCQGTAFTHLSKGNIMKCRTCGYKISKNDWLILNEPTHHTTNINKYTSNNINENEECEL